MPLPSILAAERRTTMPILARRPHRGGGSNSWCPTLHGLEASADDPRRTRSKLRPVVVRWASRPRGEVVGEPELPDEGSRRHLAVQSLRLGHDRGVGVRVLILSRTVDLDTLWTAHLDAHAAPVGAEAGLHGPDGARPRITGQPERRQIGNAAVERGAFFTGGMERYP